MSTACTCHYDEDGVFIACPGTRNTVGFPQLIEHVVAAINRLERERAPVPDDAAIERQSKTEHDFYPYQHMFVRGATWMRELLHPTPPMSECEMKYREWCAKEFPNRPPDDALLYHEWKGWQAAWIATKGETD